MFPPSRIVTHSSSRTSGRPIARRMEDRDSIQDLASPREPRTAVVTAVAGGKDILRDPIIDTDSADFFAFSDRPLPHLRHWQVRTLPQWSMDPRFGARRNAKIPKVLPELLLPGYDFFIWIDGNIELMASPRDLCRQFLIDTGADIAALPHRLRRCIYAESREVLRLSLDHPYLVKAQMREYRHMAYGQGLGLYELRFIVTRNNESTRRLGLCWFEQICRFSSRDQLRFPVALAQSGARLEPIAPGHCLDNPYMRLRPHERSDAVRPLLDRLARGARRLASRIRRRITPIASTE